MAGASAGKVEQRMGAAEWAMLAALSVLRGGSFLFSAVALRELLTFTIAARIGIAALALWAAVAVLRVGIPQAPGLWAAFLGMGLLNNAVPFALSVWVQHHVTSGLPAIRNATPPLITVAVAHLLTPDERLTPSEVGRGRGGLVAVVVMLGADLPAGLGTGLLAQVACLAAALS